MPAHLHLTDSPCSCTTCQQLDIMYGDPTLSRWESRFVKSVSEWGWHADYTPKQRACILDIFTRQKSRWLSIHA